MSRFSNPFTLKGLSQIFHPLAARLPIVYLGITFLFMLFGYVAVALFPVLLLTAVFKIWSNITTAQDWLAWLQVLVWLGIGAIAAFFTFQLIRIQIPMPSGLGLKYEKVPKLYELLDELSDVYKAPRLDRVVLYDDFGVEIIPSPRFGIPVMRNFVLRIGLPVLQSLSPEQFRGCLARRYGQYSGKHNRLTHMIYRWRQYCQQYLKVYDKLSQPTWLPIKWFFKIYTPLFNSISVHAARMDELEADRYVLEIMNDDKATDMIKRMEVSRAFLQAKFWPKIEQMWQKQSASQEHLPHASMPNVIKRGLTEQEMASWLERLQHSDEELAEGSLPPLASRLENMGHFRGALPLPLVETAAQRYLGGMTKAIIQMLDKMWLKKTAPHAVKKDDAHKPASQTTHKQQTAEAGNDHHANQIQTLKQKAKAGSASDKELFQLAKLIEQHESKTAAIKVYQAILKRDPTHANTMFAVGRILLSQNDETGIETLETAMQLEKSLTQQGCWLLANYYKKIGRKEMAKVYLDRAAKYEKESAA